MGRADNHKISTKKKKRKKRKREMKKKKKKTDKIEEEGERKINHFLKKGSWERKGKPSEIARKMAVVGYLENENTRTARIKARVR